MIFQTFDTIAKTHCQTRIGSANEQTIRLFIQTWVSDYLMRILRDQDFKYSLFQWDTIIRTSMVIGSPYRAYSAMTNSQLDGLICISSEGGKLKIEFIATSPWNYSKKGKMRGVGTGLINFVIKNSIYIGKGGAFFLNAIPDAEKFYSQIGMVPTGNQNKNGLKEFYMSEIKSQEFIVKNKKIIIEE